MITEYITKHRMGSALLLMTGVFALIVPATVNAESVAVVVNPANTQWQEVNPDALSAEFIQDETAPSGTGALKLTKQAGYDDLPLAYTQSLMPLTPYTPLYKTNVSNLPLKNISKLEYTAKYVPDTTSHPNPYAALAAPGFQMVIDYNGSAPEGQATLYLDFTSKEPLVVNEGWVKWDVYNSWPGPSWRSMNNLTSIQAFQGKGVGLDSIIQDNPDAVLTAVGFSYAGIVDTLVVNDTVYDFEPAPKTASTKDDCKNVWRVYEAKYKNQGECISSLNKQTNVLDKALQIFRELF